MHQPGRKPGFFVDPVLLSSLNMPFINIYEIFRIKHLVLRSLSYILAYETLRTYIGFSNC
jgi:hypothetical protein